MKKLEIKDFINVFMGDEYEVVEEAKKLGISLNESCYDALEYDKNGNLTMILLEGPIEKVKTTIRGFLFAHSLMNVSNEELPEDECINLGFDLVNKIDEIEQKLDLN
jgi:hypothetical protein